MKKLPPRIKSHLWLVASRRSNKSKMSFYFMKKENSENQIVADGLTGFFDLLAKFDYEDKQKEKLVANNSFSSKDDGNLLLESDLKIPKTEK